MKTTSLLLLTLLSPALVAQGADSAPLWRIDGTANFDALGWGIQRDVVDLNGDGIADLISKNPTASTNLLFKNGSVQAFSGSDGSLLWRRDGTVDGERYGSQLILAGDLDGDGAYDFFHRQPEGSYNGAVGNGSAEAISGRTGLLLWNRLGYSNGEALGSAGVVVSDLTGDGVPDVIIGSRGADAWGMQDNGYVELVNGATGFGWWFQVGMTNHEGLGALIRQVADLDGDGFNDIIVGNSEASTGAFWQNGFVQAMSGKTGAVLWRVEGSQDSSLLGQDCVSVRDANADGIPDVVVISPDAFSGMWYSNGEVKLLSGADGSQLWSISGFYHGWRLGANFNASWDLNGDGINEIVTGMPDLSSMGRTANGAIWALDGANGRLLWQRDGTDNYGRLGASFWLSADLNLDGTRDVVATAPEANAGGLPGSGMTTALNGSTGFPLWRVDGPSASAHFGQDLIRPGDLDGDGVDDYVVGTEFADSNGLSNNGTVTALNGASGATLWSVDGENHDVRLGANLESISDLDGDGFSEVICHSSQADAGGLVNNGTARAFAGSDGSELWRMDGSVNDERFGFSIQGIADLDGDGHEDLLVTAPFGDSNGLADNGYVQALSGGTSLALQVDGNSGQGGVHAGQL
ncbi:MAG: PQQ-binding-like beta-propeller repeat protein, partial [Planctomycetes bacterium]|nr:PQQ-binding-like beta-propeller repeat protein [Planctomycetota bacterium]